MVAFRHICAPRLVTWWLLYMRKKREGLWLWGNYYWPRLEKLRKREVHGKSGMKEDPSVRALWRILSPFLFLYWAVQELRSTLSVFSQKCLSLNMYHFTSPSPVTLTTLIHLLPLQTELPIRKKGVSLKNIYRGQSIFLTRACVLIIVWMHRHAHTHT